MATTTSSPLGCSDADLIWAVVGVQSAEVCAQGCAEFTEPACQDSVWKPSGDCWFYRSKCSEEATTTIAPIATTTQALTTEFSTTVTTTSSPLGCSDADLIWAVPGVGSAEVCAQGCA